MRGCLTFIMAIVLGVIAAVLIAAGLQMIGVGW